MGFSLGCVAVAGLFVQSLREKISTTIKSNENNYHLQYEDKNNSSTQDSFHSFIDTKIGYHFSDYKKRLAIELCLITCLYVTKQ